MQTDTRRDALWTKDFLTITLVNFLLFFGFQLLIPTLPLYVKAWGASDAAVGWVTGLFTISALIIRPITGWVLDRYGRRGMFVAGMVLFIFVTVMYPAVSTVALVLILRFIHGFGWGAASTASNTSASDIIPKSRFGEGIGYFSMSGNLSSALAPAVGLSLILSAGFQGVARLSSGLVLLSLLLALHFPFQKIDREARPKDRPVIFEPSSLRAAVLIFFITITYGAINSFIALYARTRGIPNIGIFFTTMAVAMLLFRPLFGRLLDKRGYVPVVLPGLFFTAAALILLYFADTLPHFLGAGAFYGIGFGALHSGLQTMAVVDAPGHRIGAANSTFFIGFDSGIGVGAVLMGMIATHVGYSRMYLMATLSILIALILFYLTGRTRKKHRYYPNESEVPSK